MIPTLAGIYDVRAIDYGAHRGNGLLICAGTGLMLSIMDQTPRLRWCVDIDAIKVPPMIFGDWLRCAENCCEMIAAAGWFSATSPAALVHALGRLRRRPPVYVRYFGRAPDPFAELRTAATLAELLAQIARFPGRSEMLAQLCRRLDPDYGEIV
jgi:hypothetical protein